ncbi:hypothetical protein GJU39_08790 [Pedobacter petrophilus]|uniref:Uncharacterized protein n=1 Tax=Pedobacter petrophilus TaxID=1908241 RepID=A0A7K0FYM9_9SPHI|nr:hypothetical protein [Pedobacter petrophilus]MRX76184.1 hypothetical protein [Pedobacter petrophilus]
MEITLEIPNDEVFSILETLKRIKGIRIKNIDQVKETYLMELSGAYKETELSEKGQIKLKRFEDLVDEI